IWTYSVLLRYLFLLKDWLSLPRACNAASKETLGFSSLSVHVPNILLYMDIPATWEIVGFKTCKYVRFFATQFVEDTSIPFSQSHEYVSFLQVSTVRGL
ncbi:hypothetical protein Tco_0313197, partial [Tanacetum coccineum]